jgi:hypothetical protein
MSILHKLTINKKGVVVLFGVSYHACDSVKLRKITEQVKSLEKYIRFFNLYDYTDVVHDIILWLARAPHVDPDADLTFLIKKLARTINRKRDKETPVEFFESDLNLSSRDCDDVVLDEVQGDLLDILKELYLCNKAEFVLLQGALETNTKPHFLDTFFIEKFRDLLKRYPVKDICTGLRLLDNFIDSRDVNSYPEKVSREIVYSCIKEANNGTIVVPVRIPENIPIKKNVICFNGKLYNMDERTYYTNLNLDDLNWSLRESSSKIIARVCLSPLIDYIYTSLEKGIDVTFADEFLGVTKWVTLNGDLEFQLNTGDFIEIVRSDLVHILSARINTLIGGSDEYLYYQINRRDALQTFLENGVDVLIPHWGKTIIKLPVEEVTLKGNGE